MNGLQAHDQRRLPQITRQLAQSHSNHALQNGGDLTNGFRDQEREYLERELQFEDELEVEKCVQMQKFSNHFRFSR